MKKNFPTYLDRTAATLETISISAGQRGRQILLAPTALTALSGATFADLTMDDIILTDGRVRS